MKKPFVEPYVRHGLAGEQLVITGIVGMAVALVIYGGYQLFILIKEAL